MNTIAISNRASMPSEYGTRQVLAAYALEAKTEFLRVLRTPSFAIPSLLFPPMFYLLFAILLNRGSSDAARYLFATYSVFGVMAPGLFGFGVSVAIERERGWLALKRVAPMPSGAYLASKMIMAAAFALIIYLMLATMAFTLGGIRLDLGQWLLLGVITTLGVLPFCAIGLLVGSRVSAAAAPAIVNFIYLPMAFLSGLWMPLTMLPAFIGQMAVSWPPYHLALLALAAIGPDPGVGTVSGHLLYLVAFTVVCFAIARRWLARAS